MINCPHCQTSNHPSSGACETCGAPLAADPALGGDPFVGRQLGGRFTLQSIVGSGEIGMVYRGIDSRTGTPVAVKLVHPDVAATHGDELLRSASMVAQLRHAKIAQVLAAAREPDGTSYIVTEFIEGRTLKALLEETGPLGPRRSADIMFQLCSALAPIHRAGRPHANLKPENVFLVAREQVDFVKIVDVGSPDLFGVRDTLSGKLIVGSPKFFSPEQALGHRVGLASDQFTLGVIGYQLLTGALPFFGATPDQLLASIASGRPTPVTERISGFTEIPEKLVHTIHRCLDKDPKARYPDLRGLAVDLAAVIKSTPEDPAPRPRPEKNTFGAGLDVSTRIANPGALNSLFDGEEDDEDRTRLRDFAVEDLEAALGPSSTIETGATPLGGDPTPYEAAPASRPPTQNDMQDIPEPLAVTGAIGSDELSAALADALAGVDTNTPSPSRSGGGGLGDDLMAALDSAAAEVGAPASKPLAAPGFGAAAPLEVGSSGNAGFDPFGGVGGGDAPVEAPAPRRSVPPGQMSSVIGDALADAVDGQASGLHRMGASAASPLATAADFAALSPVALEAARGGGNGKVGRSTLPPVSTASRGNRSLVTALVLLALLAVVGGGAFWWQQEEAQAEQAAAEKAARDRKRQKRRAAKAATAATRIVKARIESTPPGATVFLGETELGTTPLDVEIEGVYALSYVLKLGGHDPATQEIDPNAIQEGAEPPVFKVALSNAADAGAAVEPPKPVAATKLTPEPKKPRVAPVVPAPAAVKKKPKRKRKAKSRRKKKKKKPKKSDIKDPFAD